MPVEEEDSKNRHTKVQSMPVEEGSNNWHTLKYAG